MNTFTTPGHGAPPASGAWRPTPLVAASMGLHALALGSVAVDPQLWPWAVGAVAGDHLFMGGLGLLPRSTWIGANIRRLPPGAAARREIALTFDDGPDPEVTPKVLEILAAREARCTFFCVGERVHAHADLCREIVRRGHTVENHSYRHPEAFMLLGWRNMERQITQGQQAILDVTGIAPRFFRAPLGFRSPLVDPLLHRAGLRLVSWTRRGFDTNTQPRRVVKRLTRKLGAGDILLLHDHNSAITPAGTPGVLESLPRMLEAIERAGLHCVTLRDAIPA